MCYNMGFVQEHVIVCYRLAPCKQSRQSGTINNWPKKRSCGNVEKCFNKRSSTSFRGASENHWETGKEEARHRFCERFAALWATQSHHCRRGPSNQDGSPTAQISDCSCNVKTVGRRTGDKLPHGATSSQRWGYFVQAPNEQRWPLTTTPRLPPCLGNSSCRVRWTQQQWQTVVIFY